MQAVVASCSTCRLRPKEDGGAGGCTRTAVYPELKQLFLHDCPLFKREPLARGPKVDPQKEGLF